MEYRSIPGTDMKLSVVVFGSWANGGWSASERTDAVKAVQASYQAGVTSFDTAPLYGLGDAETIIGEAIECLPRDKIQILTKFGLRWDINGGIPFSSMTNAAGNRVDIVRHAGRDSIIAECEGSLKRLKTDYIDIYQLHWPDDATPMDETFEAVQMLIHQGKVRYAGVANYSGGQMAEAEKHIHIVSNQIPYSMINRGVEEETLRYCLDHKKAVLAYRPLESGLLTGTINPGTVFPKGDFRRDNARFTDENIRRVDNFVLQLKPLAEDRKITIAQLVLRWTIQRTGISAVLAGARTPEQAVENAKAGDFSLTKKEMGYIDSVLPPV